MQQSGVRSPARPTSVCFVDNSRFSIHICRSSEPAASMNTCEEAST